jgi:biotin carboxyl carrier protein
MRRYTLQIGEREFVIEVQETAADQFDVVVGSESYAVTLAGDEDMARASITPAISSAPAAVAVSAAPAAAAPASPRAAAPTPAAPAPRKRAGGAVVAGALNSPMPGVILEVNVKVGDVVERGHIVAVLEAMKMNNAIKAPRAGTIAEVFISAGQAVGHGEPLIRFQEG